MLSSNSQADSKAVKKFTTAVLEKLEHIQFISLVSMQLKSGVI